METATYDLPAHWANALFYGDLTGLDEQDHEAMTQLVAGEQLPDPLSCSDEPFFAKYHDATPYGMPACNCLTFTFPD